MGDGDTMTALGRGQFEQLLAEHERLIDQVNEAELRLHALAEGPGEGRLEAMQQATGDLLKMLRDHLFRQDQVVLPAIDGLTRASGGTDYQDERRVP
jgi:hypothetical protein